MVQVGVTGDQRNVPQTVEWTIEHHKLFVDQLLKYGGFEKLGPSIQRKMMKSLKKVKGFTLTYTAASDHSRRLKSLQKGTQLLLSRPPPRKRILSVDDLVRELEGLTIERKPSTVSTWTLEHHKRVVDAVTKMGDLNMTNPTAKTAVRVLGLMEEERRQGLTVWMVTSHLKGLHLLQRRTQEAIVKAAELKVKYGCSVKRSKKVKMGRRNNNDNRPAECRGHSDHMRM